MMRGPSQILPVTLGRIVRANQTVYSAFSTLLARSRAAASGIEFDAGFAVGTYRVVEPACFNDAFMNLRSANLRPRAANILPLTALNIVKVGSTC